MVGHISSYHQNISTIILYILCKIICIYINQFAAWDSVFSACILRFTSANLTISVQPLASYHHPSIDLIGSYSDEIANSRPSNKSQELLYKPSYSEHEGTLHTNHGYFREWHSSHMGTSKGMAPIHMNIEGERYQPINGIGFRSYR